VKTDDRYQAMAAEAGVKFSWPRSGSAQASGFSILSVFRPLQDSVEEPDSHYRIQQNISPRAFSEPEHCDLARAQNSV